MIAQVKLGLSYNEGKYYAHKGVQCCISEARLKRVEWEENANAESTISVTVLLLVWIRYSALFK